MYHKNVVQQRLTAAFKAINASKRQPGQAEITPDYHSPEQCQAARKHLEKIRDPETGNLNRQLTPEEFVWVRNERILCQCDFGYWLTRYAHIRDWSDHVALITPNIAQRMVISIWGEMEEAQFAILMLQLKARRLGVSTVTELAVAHRSQFYSNINSVVASSDPDKSAEMAGIMELTWDNSPWWLMPSVTAQRSGTLIEFGMQNSAVSIQHGTQFSGIARGSTPSVFHLSELPDFNDPEGLIDASLLRAVIDSPSTFGVLESTAAGRGNWLHKKWKFCVSNWPKTSRLRPVFLPWYVGSDIYPTATWLRQHPIPANHQFQSITLRHAERATEYVRTNELLRRYLGEDWKMPERQMWFWEATRQEYEAQGTLGKFLSELCSDDVEAFQHDKHNPFGVELISQYHAATSRLTPRVYGFQGRGNVIPDRLQPDRRDIDPNLPPINYKPLPGATAEAPRDVRLVPLKWQGASTFDPLGKLLIWKDWEEGYTYANGVDTAYGIGKDRSVIETLREGTLDRNEEQCAEFACIAPDTQVVLADRACPAEKVKAGDIVVTRLGTYAKVGHVVRNTQEEAIELYTGMATNVPLVLTTDHQVSTESGWIEAGKLKKGDWLRYPVRPLTGRLSDDIELRYKHDDIKVSLSSDFGFLCGLYLAEGCLIRHKEGWFNQVRFTIHKREADPWIERIRRIHKWHIKPREVKSCRNARYFEISCASLAQWMSNNFGESKTKHIPSWVWDAPRDFIEGLVEAMVAGDGGISRVTRYVKYTSIVPSLVIGLRELVLSLGWGLGTISRYIRHLHGKQVNDAWNLNLYGECSQPFLHAGMWKPLPPAYTGDICTSVFRWGWDKQWIYVKVKRIKKSTQKEFIDVHVEGPEPSFCVTQAAVHNSPFVNAADLAPLAYIIGSLYTAIEPGGNVKQCHQVIEVQANGEITQLQLRKMGWKEFHHWVRYDRKKINPKRSDRLGWATVPWSRALLMSWCIKYLRDGWVDINSPWFVEEMQALVQDDYAQQLKAEYGEFDDRFMAFGIALVHLNMLSMRGGGKTIAERRVAHRAMDDPDAPPEQYSYGGQAEPRYASGAQSILAELEDSW